MILKGDSEDLAEIITGSRILNNVHYAGDITHLEISDDSKWMEDPGEKTEKRLQKVAEKNKKKRLLT